MYLTSIISASLLELPSHVATSRIHHTPSRTRVDVRCVGYDVSLWTAYTPHSAGLNGWVPMLQTVLAF